MGKSHSYKLKPLNTSQNFGKFQFGRRSTRRRNRRNRYFTNRTPRRDLGPAAPPPLSMMSNQCSLWLRTVQKLTFNKGKYNEKWNPSITTLVGEPWNQLSKIFAEIKVSRINVYLYTRNTNLSSVGIHTLVVSDTDEIYDLKRDFISTSSAPGAVTRRITQPLHGSWFPTEPSDREWALYNSKSTYLDVAYSVDGAILPLDFDIFFDVHCHFRGLKHPASISDFISDNGQVVSNDINVGPVVESNISSMG